MGNKKTIKHLQKSLGLQNMSWLYDSDFLAVYSGKKPKSKVEKQWNDFINYNLKGGNNGILNNGVLDSDLSNTICNITQNMISQINNTYEFLDSKIIDKFNYSTDQQSNKLLKTEINKFYAHKPNVINDGFLQRMVVALDKNRTISTALLKNYIFGTSMHQKFRMPGLIEVTDTPRYQLDELRLFNTLILLAPKTTQKHIVWRGLGLGNNVYKNGDKFSSSVCMSTSTRSSVSIEWMVERLACTCCLLHITVPENTPSLWVGFPPNYQATINSQCVKAIDNQQKTKADLEPALRNIHNLFPKDSPIHYQYEVILPPGEVVVNGISEIDLLNLDPEQQNRFGQYWYKDLLLLLNKMKTIESLKDHGETYTINKQASFISAFNESTKNLNSKSFLSVDDYNKSYNTLRLMYQNVWENDFKIKVYNCSYEVKGSFLAVDARNGREYLTLDDELIREYNRSLGE